LEEIGKVIGDATKMIAERLETHQTMEALRRQNQQFEFLLRQRLLS
jgi:ubiquitin